ncbi:hypothetical protein GCM10009610_44610 [Pseudonocardia xinjiangensis]
MVPMLQTPPVTGLQSRAPLPWSVRSQCDVPSIGGGKLDEELTSHAVAIPFFPDIRGDSRSTFRRPGGGSMR